MTKNKKMMISALPFVALVVLLAVFCGIVSLNCNPRFHTRYLG